MTNILLMNIKNCPQCGYRVEDPNTLRCPRCNKSLLKPACCHGSCGSCGVEREAVPEECADWRKTGCLYQKG
ncbi:hypothetical protein L7E55_04645 [Pelotomaculum isophthalicicum JI]|uniref:DZANK-type domain-containing protein n=1 Tax=Pelotomaculum isophthalicicum JI TaxID=947010 RepID=A0A9X4H300_9FIRM|nr:hypothetical protein [Pelotomaculum isophthalicicum]MDF9407653.1 hypothetical protein [Pelotomaculum isophthalicicum JI]